MGPACLTMQSGGLCKLGADRQALSDSCLRGPARAGRRRRDLSLGRIGQTRKYNARLGGYNHEGQVL